MTLCKHNDILCTGSYIYISNIGVPIYLYYKIFYKKSAIDGIPPKKINTGNIWKQILSRLVTRINAIQYKQKDKEYGRKQKWKDSVSGTRTKR